MRPRRLIAAVAIGVTVTAGCGSPGRDIKPQAEVDEISWRAEFVARTVTSDNPDMDDLYRMAVDDCAASVDDLSFRLASPAVDPNLVLPSLKYVCPGQQQKVNDAMSELQNSAATFTEACETAKDQLTIKQQKIVDIEGTCSVG